MRAYLEQRQQHNIRALWVSGASGAFDSILDQLCAPRRIPTDGQLAATLRALRAALMRHGWLPTQIKVAGRGLRARVTAGGKLQVKLSKEDAAQRRKQGTKRATRTTQGAGRVPKEQAP